MRTARTALVVLMIVALVPACGTAGKKKRSEDGVATEGTADQNSVTDAGAGTGNDVEESIRLLDAGGLAMKLDAAVGSGKAINTSDPNENLIETYASNFGIRKNQTAGDLGSDKLTPNSLMINYLLALNIVAYNAALHCEGAGRKGLCDCSSADASLALMKRVAPYRGFESAEEKELASTFANLCGEDYIRALSATLSSVAFAKRN